MLSTHSFNALLKTLEEPPPHVKFLLATTDPQKLPATILSRCLQFNLKRMAAEMIAGHLEYVLTEEGISFDKLAIVQIAEGADGSMRDALSLLDQAIAYGGGKLVDEEVRAMLGTIDRSYIYKLLQGLADADAAGILETVNGLAQQGVDFTAVLAELVSQLHKLALTQVVPQTAEGLAEQEAIIALAQAISQEDIQLYYQIGLIGRRDLPFAPELRGGFEMIMLRMLAFRPDANSQQKQTSNAAPQAVASSRQSPAAAASMSYSSTASVVAPAAVSEPGPAAASAAGSWHEIVAQLGLRGMAQQLAANSEMVSRDGTVIRLALSSQHASLRRKSLEMQLQGALQKYFGEPVKLEFSVAADSQAQHTPAVIDKRQAENRQQTAIDAINADPNVRRIQENFNAQVVTDSVRPIE